MSTQKNLITLCIATVFTLGLAACGGGGGGGGDAPVTSMMDTTTTPPTMIAGKTVPSGTTITLPAGTDAPTVTFSAVMDEMITVEDFGTFTCVSADGCSVAVADDVVTTTGDILVVSVEDGVAALIAAALPPEPVELNELETAQADAAAAATAAMTAAGNANTTATEAETARATAATLQTGETSEGLAEKAREQAGMAHTAYMDAKAASEAAAEADNVSDAIRAQVDAENARDAAQDAETNAGKYAQMAADAAGSELMIVGTVKTVGGTSLDATAAATQMVDGLGDDAQTTRTGLLDKTMQPMTEGPATPGRTAVAGDEDAASNPYKSPMVNANPRSFPIGKLVDSADDMARLRIVTQYAGTDTVKVYAGTDGGELTGSVGKDGRIDTTPLNVEDDEFVTLKPVGMYYRASTGASLDPQSPEDDGTPRGDTVAFNAMPVQVYSYVNDSGGTVYVELKTTETTGATTTDTYSNVEIHIVIDRGDGGTTPDMVEVTAKIPQAADYKHIHFGVWAGLGEAKEDGSQVPADLGIGFVQNFSGEGMTPIGGGSDDMPNGGTGTYNGNWVATVQAANDDGNGKVSLESGMASLTADFGKGNITASLAGLAMLKGDISGNTFSGDKASVSHSAFEDGADFEGSFGGGFYGAKAAEAGGIFDFASDDGNNEGGAFRGAFGADKK